MNDETDPRPRSLRRFASGAWVLLAPVVLCFALAPAASASSPESAALLAASGNGLLVAALGGVLLAGLTAAGIWWDRRRRLDRAGDREAHGSRGASPRPVDAAGRTRNEREAVVLMAYGWLVEHAARHGVFVGEEDTLRDFEQRIRAETGVDEAALEALFDAFEAAFYQDRPSVSAQREAVRCCLAVLEELEDQTTPRVEFAPTSETSRAPPRARSVATA